jgi:hypothetical protein
MSEKVTDAQISCPPPKMLTSPIIVMVGDDDDHEQTYLNVSPDLNENTLRADSLNCNIIVIVSFQTSFGHSRPTLH